jgi:hypothetical protein
MAAFESTPLIPFFYERFFAGRDFGGNMEWVFAIRNQSAAPEPHGLFFRGASPPFTEVAPQTGFLKPCVTALVQKCGRVFICYQTKNC